MFFKVEICVSIKDLIVLEKCIKFYEDFFALLAQLEGKFES